MRWLAGSLIQPIVVALHDLAQFISLRVGLDLVVQLAQLLALGWLEALEALVILRQLLAVARIHLLEPRAAFDQALVG